MPVTNTSATILVCKSEETIGSKVIVALPSFVTSLVALILSYTAYKYNRNKDKRARTQSINDDFWLRKVVSPVAIEPFVKFTISLTHTLPRPVDGSEKVQIFWVETTQKLTEFSASFANLELISPDLNRSVALQLEGIEDAIAEYCGSLQQHLNDSAIAAPDRASLSSKVSQINLAIMRGIAAFQANVGEN